MEVLIQIFLLGMLVVFIKFLYFLYRFFTSISHLGISLVDVGIKGANPSPTSDSWNDFIYQHYDQEFLKIRWRLQRELASYGDKVNVTEIGEVPLEVAGQIIEDAVEHEIIYEKGSSISPKSVMIRFITEEGGERTIKVAGLTPAIKELEKLDRAHDYLIHSKDYEDDDEGQKENIKTHED